MDKQEMVKALNRIYLVLELSESVHAQIEHGDDWENKALMRESILTLMGQRLDDENASGSGRTAESFRFGTIRLCTNASVTSRISVHGY